MKRAVVASVVVLLAAPAIRAQQPSPEASPERPPVFRTATNLVPLNVTVIDSKNHFVKGLQASDFVVFEDGVQQQLEFFEPTEVPLDLMIMLDTSSSMSDKMEVVHEAAIGFLRSLRPQDRGAVVAFAEGVNVLQELTSDRAALDQAVRRTTARGATSLHNALYIALKQFAPRTKAEGDIRRRAIAVLSDGEDTSSLISFDDVLAVARRSGVSIYPISLQSKYTAARIASGGQRRFFSQAEFSLRRLAQETGGEAFFPLQVVELKGVYAAIAEELSCQYSLAYASANSEPDGRFRRIVVRVTSRPDLKLRTRTGYVAELARTMPATTPVADQQR